ncbi:MAG TPA: NADPH-dependent 7-cyano-7-deazaguanine reductase QueF [Pseudomonadales bacterium]
MDIPLGKPTDYPERYDPSLLAPIDRQPARAAMGLDGPLPFVGEDVWNAYEFSWLGTSGLPRVAVLQIRVPADSPRIVESKSMKLYLNGFAQARFGAAQAVTEVLERDLAGGFGAPVSVRLLGLDAVPVPSAHLPGQSLDGLDVAIETYRRDPGRLRIAEPDITVEETLHTHLFRSLCPVTSQPDWASLLVRYRGPAIDHESLLEYFVSFRTHQGFHETTVEQIFLDLKAECRCERLLIAGYFLRRGGIDINPFRSDPGEAWPELRLIRQ